MMKSAQVNAHVARDLVSHAGSNQVADLKDFLHPQLNSKKIQGQHSGGGEDDLRSIKSEYDYGSKKKFLDVLGNISIDAKLQRLRALHEMEKTSGKCRA